MVRQQKGQFCKVRESFKSGLQNWPEREEFYMTQKKTYLSWLLGLICAFSLMIVFLITSVEAVAYWTPHYYENEYTRYQVADDVHMEMDDLLYVTDEMMAYLRGSRDDLNIDTVVDGTPREFFNAREKAHMADVRNLFLGGLALRRLCLFLAAASVALLALLKAPLKHLLPRMLCAGTVLFLGVTALLAGIISTDFTKYFIIFHKIFFTNDLWQLDPRTDLLINIVPEPFFMDTAARIGITFCLMTGALFLLCLACILREHRRGKSGAENSGNSGGGSSPGSSSHPAAPDLKTKIAGSTGSKLSLFLIGTLLLSLLAAPMQALASTEWPSDISIDSDAGIVMDADTGVVLYGKNIHETYSPASITKVLTSLIVLEHCSLDETVTFSESAVYNVESNSSSAGYDTGDTASVKDCLYALLLKSANEAANALAEHVAGSADAFAVLMNEKAAELGCQDSHFANPSGLNNEEHYVSAYDMALITRAAFENPTFAKIVETTYYKLPPNQKNPEGQGISPGNKLVKKNWPQYYRPDVLGGKTGYTSIALNTLVNGARQGDTTLITVILHSNNTQYEDTSRLLDFGFNNFQSVKIADYDQTFSNIGKDLKIADVSTAGGESLSIDPDSRVVLPKTADFSETTTSFDYEIPAGAPDGTIACVTYSLGDHKVGQAYLTLTDSSQTAADIPEKLVSQAATATAQDSSDTALSDGSSEALPLSNPPESAANQENSSTGKSFGQLFHISVRVPPAFIAALTAILVVIGAVTAGIRFLQMQRRQEEDALAERRRRRAERLRDSGMSEADFDLMMQDRRTALAKKRKKRSHKIP